MHWNYRAILHHHVTGDYYAIHEVYYDENDKLTGYTQTPVQFICDREEGHATLVRSLETALADLKASQPLDEEDA